MKTVRRMVSVLLVLCLLLSNIGITAFAESVLALPASTRIIEQEAFFKAQSLNKVVLAEGLLEIRARAFASSTVKSINFPSSITFIADDAFDDTPLTNVTAVEGTYAYDWAVEHHYIIPKVPIVINSFAADAASVQLGAPVTWTVNVEGGVLPLSYNYAVFKNGLYQDTLSVSDATESVFTFTPTSDGSWSVLVTITDVLETVASQVSGSVYVVDLSSYGDAGLTLTTGLNTYLVGDVAHITAEKQNTYGNVQYAFSATDASGNTLAAQSASSDPSFSLTLSNAGDVTITGTVTDELGRSASAQRTFHVYSEEELKPAAPAVIQVNGEELSSTVENSVLYPQKSFRISWDQVDTADNYSIQIIKTEGNETTTLVSADGITERSYNLSAELFAMITEEALVQVSVSAQNRVSGDAAIGYFRVKTLQEQNEIYINGETSAEWNEVYYAAANRMFTVTTDSDWTYSSDQEWITCYKNEDQLTVHLEDNPYDQLLTGTVTVSNGTHTAQITITHSYLKKAPQLLTPALSQNESSPSELPYGNLYLKYNENDADTVTARLYKRDGTSYINILENTSQKDYMTLVVPASISSGDYCMLELIGYTPEAFNSQDESVSKTTARYYFVFSNSGHFALVNGQSNYSVTILTSETIQVYASTVWSYEIDCDWLTLSADGIPDEKCYIQALPNLENSQREGHISITAGTAVAIITVIQDTFIPYISYPSGLSQNESSPTAIAYNDFSVIYHMASSLDLIKISDGSNAFDVSWSSIEIEQAETIEKADLLANTAYKIILSNEYASRTYYVKTASSSWNSYYINLSDDTETEKNYISWNASAGQQSKQIKLKANGSWTITCNADWLSVSSSSGSSATSGKMITVNIQENTTGKNRSGTVVFKRATSAEAVLNVEQAGMDYIVVMNNDTLVPYNSNDTIQHVSGQEDYFQVRVIAGCLWSVVSDSSWLTFDRSNSTSKTVTETNAKLRLYCSENPVGNQSRTAKLTFSSGNESFVLYVSQDACIGVPVVTTSVTSTNINLPSVIMYQDIVFSWTPVPGASKYVVKVMTDASDSALHYYIVEDGSSEYSFTIPYSWLSVDGKAYFFRVNSIDYQGYEYTGPRYCYTVVYDDKAIVNGSLNPVWDNASDYQATREFKVMSSFGWTAVPQQSWIHVSPASGESGDTLTVVLDDNFGARRDGSVKISVNGNETILNISQCAVLTEWPSINMPAYSDDEFNPTIVTTDLSPLTVTWDIEPQADSYFIHIDSYKSTGRWHGEAEAENIQIEQAGSYTFNDLQLEADKLYRITLVRCAKGRGNAGVSVYFIPQNGTSSVSIGRTSSMYPDRVQLLGEEDHEYFYINSSGNWIATTDSDWIMVYKNYLDQADLEENGRDPSYYNSYIGNADTYLYISALANTTGAPRYGNVTVTCGSATLTIPVLQDISVTTAKVYNPILGSKKDPSHIPYQSLTVRWTQGEGGNNHYRLILKEKEAGENDWLTVLETVSTTDRSYTIPQRYLHQNNDYILRLFTETDGIDDQYENYYFHVDFDYEITASLVLNTASAYVGGKIGVIATPSGGVGNYYYEFSLYKDGELVHAYEMDDIPSRLFAIAEPGIYQIRIYIEDAMGNSTIAVSSSFVVSAAYEPTGTPASSAIPGEPTPRITPLPALTVEPGAATPSIPNATSVPSIIEDVDKSFYFTMSMSETPVNKTLYFEVYADNADKVKLYVDNVGYEEYDVINGWASFSRSFSQEGLREIYFVRHVYGEWFDKTNSQVLNVLTPEKQLDNPVINPIDSVFAGNKASISWKAVENAQWYKLIISKDNVQKGTFIAIQDESVNPGDDISSEIPCSILKDEGQYFIYLMALAEGYAVSNNSAYFNVIAANSVVEIKYPYNGESFNLGQTMQTELNIARPNMYSKLVVTHDEDSPIEYYPDGEGLFCPIAQAPGEYSMTAIVSEHEDFSDYYESKTIYIIVDDPKAMIKDIWGNSYGVVFTDSTFTANITVNCAGVLKCFVDNRETVNVTQNNTNQYQYELTASGLSEGLHTVSAKVIYNNYASRVSTLNVYSITQLPAEEQLIYYASSETKFEYYPGSKNTKVVPYKAPVTYLGTYGSDYAYVHYGKLYGFVPKAVFVSLEEINLMDVNSGDNATSNANANETAYREWAANVISEYYNGYGMFPHHLGEKYMAKFKNIHPIWNFVAGKNDADVTEMMTNFDAINRHYYFTSIFKQYYDNYGRKSTYTVIQYTYDNDEEYKEKMKEYYKELLINTLMMKCEVDKESFERINTKDAGLYTLKYNASTGLMEMQLDANGRMGNLHETAVLEAQKAWGDFAFDLTETCIDVAIDYFNNNPFSDAAEFSRVLGETITHSLISVINNSFDSHFDNEINKLENRMQEIIKVEIANSVLQDYNRIIAYLQNIYNGEDDTLIEYISDPIYKECVLELIYLAKQQRFVQSEKAAKDALADWAVNGASKKIVLSNEELFQILIEDLIDQLTSSLLKVINAGIKRYSGSNSTIEKGLSSIVSSFLSVLVHEMVCDVIKTQKEGEKYNIDSIRGFDNGLAKITASVGSETTKLIQKLEDEKTKLSTADSVAYDMLCILIQKLSDITVLLNNYREDGNKEAFWEGLRNTFLSLIGDILTSSWNMMAKVNYKGAGELPTKMSQAINIVVNMKDDILATADSLAKAYIAEKNLLGNEKQVSLNASLMYASYKASVKYLLSLKSEIESLKARADQKGVSLENYITNKDSINTNELMKITDKIMLQAETDLVGSNYFINLMQLCKNSGWRPQFYSDLLTQIKGTTWENQINLDNAILARSTMNNYYSRWKSGWKEEFRQFEK